MIIMGLDTCDGKGLKSPLRDIHGKELVCGDRVLVHFNTPREDGIIEVKVAFATVVYEYEKDWALYAGRKLGFLAHPLTQEYIAEHEVERHRYEDANEIALKAYKAASKFLKKQKRRNKQWKKN